MKESFTTKPHYPHDNQDFSMVSHPAVDRAPFAGEVKFILHAEEATHDQYPVQYGRFRMVIVAFFILLLEAQAAALLCLTIARIWLSSTQNQFILFENDRWGDFLCCSSNICLGDC